MYTFEVRVVPNAKKEHIKIENGALKLYIRKPALDGRANKEVVLYFSKIFGISKSDITIVSGEKNRNKRISANVSEADFKALCDRI